MTIEFKGSDSRQSFEIFNHSGCLQERILSNGVTKLTIDVADVIPGIYFLNVNTKQGSLVWKFVKI
ncbi:MAG: T9SS type A sorting domain-containing protein [Saprospiraceae bacterium]|nr:T9SS type A sorting domain-containing protein [Saprospiraceae bacterium]